MQLLQFALALLIALPAGALFIALRGLLPSRNAKCAQPGMSPAGGYWD